MAADPQAQVQEKENQVNKKNLISLIFFKLKKQQNNAKKNKN